MRARAAGPRTLALAGAATISFSSILVRLSDTSASTAAIFRCVYAVPLLAWFAHREERRLGRRSLRERGFGFGAGIFFATDIMLWNHSILDVGAGLATVLANIQVVALPLVAWALLGERPNRRLAAALPLAALGVLLISGALEHGAYGRAPGRGTLFGLAAGVAYVGFLLLLRHSSRDRRPAGSEEPVHPIAGPLFDATLVAAIACLAGGAVIGDARLVPAWPSAGWLLLLALGPQVLGWLLIASSLPRLPASLGALLLASNPIASVCLGVVILGEAPTALQLVGVTLVLGALLTATGVAPRLRRRAPYGR